MICLSIQESQVRSLGQEDPLEKGNGYPLQYSCLDNSMDRGAWRATIHGVAKSDMIEQLTFNSVKYCIKIESILIICRLQTCEFAYLLKCICNLQINTCRF